MGILMLLFFSGAGTFILWLILAFFGVIISALSGLLAPYLILCFFGIMGNKQ